MKATGIVRRIDDLGRVVIPKEIRRTMRIREGDPLQTTLNTNFDFLLAFLRLADRLYINNVRKICKWLDTLIKICYFIFVT